MLCINSIFGCNVFSPKINQNCRILPLSNISNDHFELPEYVSEISWDTDISGQRNSVTSSVVRRMKRRVFFDNKHSLVSRNRKKMGTKSQKTNQFLTGREKKDY